MSNIKLEVGKEVETTEGYRVKIVSIGEIQDGGIWAMIPSTQERITVEFLMSYPGIDKGEIHTCHPSHLKLEAQ